MRMNEPAHLQANLHFTIQDQLTLWESYMWEHQVCAFHITCVSVGGLGRPTLPSGVFVVFYEPGQAEVSDFAHQAVSHQDVGGAQVSVDVVHPLDVGHACCHLEHSTMRAAASH